MGSFSKLHMSGAVLRNEMAEIRRGRMNRNKGTRLRVWGARFGVRLERWLGSALDKRHVLGVAAGALFPVEKEIAVRLGDVVGLRDAETMGGGVNPVGGSPSISPTRH